MNKIRLLMLLLFVSSFASASPLKKTESFWNRVLKFLGVSATPSNQKGRDESVEVIEGDIYIYDVATKSGSALKIGSFRSPIFLASDRQVLALSGDRVVRIDVANGAVTDLFPSRGIKKLIGIEQGAPDQVLVISDLDNDNCPSVGVLKLADGFIDNIPYGNEEEDKTLVSHLRDWTREYDGGKTLLEVKTITKKRNGADVKATDAFLKLPDKDPINVSRCPTESCGQPSISNDRKSVLFVGKV